MFIEIQFLNCIFCARFLKQHIEQFEAFKEIGLLNLKDFSYYYSECINKMNIKNFKIRILIENNIFSYHFKSLSHQHD